MANNVTLNAGSGGSTLATEQNGSVEHYQKIKLVDGTPTAFTNMAAVTSGSALKVDGSGAAQPITDNGTNLHIQGAGASGAAKAGNPVQVGGVFNTTQPTVTTGQGVELQATARGAEIVATGADTFNVTVNAALPAGTNVIGHVIADSGSTTAVTGTVTVAGAVTEATLDAAIVAQEATTSGVKGLTAFGAVTTAKPTYTTAKSDALSLDVNGLLRVSVADTPVNGTALKVDGSGVTQPVSGTVTTTPPSNASTNIAQINGVAPLMGNGITGTGSQRVTVASDQTAFAVNATLQAGSAVVGHVIADSGSTTAVTGTVTVSGAVTEATLDAALIAQEATTSGIKGVTAFGAVTTAKPTYTTAKSDALSLDTSGLLRVSLADTPANGTKLLVTPDSVALPANQSVNVAQVNGNTTVTAATGVQKVGIVGNAGAAVDAALGTQGTNGVSVMPAAATSGGCSFTSIVAANSNNKTQLKASAGQIYKIEVYSIDAAPQYVKVFNKTSANVTAGTTACDWQIMVPANATAANGAGVTSSYELGVAMGTAMTIMVTAAIGTTDNTSVPANKSIINVFWI